MIPSILLAAITATVPIGANHSNESQTIPWYEGKFDQAMEVAVAKDKPIFLYCWGQQSETCSKFQSSTLADEKAIASVQDYLCLGANVGAVEGRQLIDHYGVQTLPTILIIRPDGKVDDAILGMIGADGFVDEMKRIQRGEGTVTALIAEVDRLAKSKDLHAAIDARFRLIGKFNDVGRREEATSTKNEIFKLDPKSKTLIASRLWMWDLMEASWGESKDQAEGADAKEMKADYSDLEKFAKKTKHSELSFEAWAWMAKGHYHAEDSKNGRAALMMAMESASPESEVEFGAQVSEMFFKDRDQLSRKERKFAGTLEQKLHHGGEAQLASMNEKRAACEASCGEEGCGNYGCGSSEEDWNAQVVQMRAGLMDAAAMAFLSAGENEQALHLWKECQKLAPAREGLAERIELVTAG